MYVHVLLLLCASKFLLSHTFTFHRSLQPQRSPDAQKLVASIEGAPSFSLFNQSFDSFGDGHYFNVDASLQNDSFGMVRATSVDNDGPNILQSTSVGNFSQQLLASGSGALTLGYSPVNSFGNVSASGGSRRGGTMMVVGGNEGRASSPTQVLGMYRSYSASGNGGPGPGGARPPSALEDSHLRMSVGSFGSPSMAYSRSYGGEPAGASPYYYPPGGPMRSQDNMDKFNPAFHIFLRRHRNAFKDCTFLLPGLKAALLETPRNETGDGPPTSSPSGEDTMVRALVHGGSCPFAPVHVLRVSNLILYRRKRRRASHLLCSEIQVPTTLPLPGVVLNVLFSRLEGIRIETATLEQQGLKSRRTEARFSAVKKTWIDRSLRP